MLSPEFIAALRKLSRTGRIGPCDDGYQLVKEHSKDLISSGYIKRFGGGMAYGTGTESGLFMITKAGVAAYKAAKANPREAKKDEGSWPFPVRVR